MGRRLGIWLVFGLLIGSATLVGAEDRGLGLRSAWQSDTAVRSVFFVRGMSCRACTVVMDRRLAKMPGVLWARFNYPLRLLTVYHEPAELGAQTLIEWVAGSEELRAVPLETRPTAELQPAAGRPIASWRETTVTSEAVEQARQRFVPVLDREFGTDEGGERPQVEYEILGEIVRNRLVAEEARRLQLDTDQAVSDLPLVVQRDFYWPPREPITAEERAMAVLLTERVLGDPFSGEARERFDAWLLELYRKVDLQFAGELLAP